MYENLRKTLMIAESGDEETLEAMCLTFEITLATPGPKGHRTRTVELVPGGGDVVVSCGNCSEFVRRYAMYLMQDEVRPALEAIRSGLSAIVPLPLFGECRG